MTNAGALPLKGLKILDLSRVLAGPLCTMVLADLGADITKVEDPHKGDETREWGPPFHNGQSAYFQSVNRHKRSLSLNLKTKGGQEVLARLIKHSHVVIENFPPATARKLGVSEEQIKAHNPTVVHCSISGFGRDSAWRDVPGYDFIIQALSGLMSITGEKDGAPMKVGVALTDVVTGLFAAVGILAALCRPGAPTTGRFVDVGLFQAAVASLVNVVQGHLVTGQVPKRYGNEHPHIVPYQCFATADGYLVVAVGNDRQFMKLVTCLGLTKLAQDTRFATNPERLAARGELVAAFDALFRTKPSKHWSDLLSQNAIPCGAVLNVAEAMELMKRIEPGALIKDAEGQTYVGSPIRFDHQPQRPAVRPPRLGEHSNVILQDLGLTPEQIAVLKKDGVI